MIDCIIDWLFVVLLVEFLFILFRVLSAKLMVLMIKTQLVLHMQLLPAPIWA